jgi:glucose-1-phosphatase
MDFNGNKIEAVIFDLGGVILNIDIEGPFQKLKELGIRIDNDGSHNIKNNDIFMRFEIGEISPEEFRNEFRKISNKDYKDSEFDKIWNSIILDFPKENISFIEKIKPKYRTFLMSNTNLLHCDYYTKMLNDNYAYSSLDDLFEKTYYSHTSGMRKPNTDFFKHIIKENHLKPSCTLFIDDYIENIEAAKQIGLNTFHIANGQNLQHLNLI